MVKEKEQVEKQQSKTVKKTQPKKSKPKVQDGMTSILSIAYDGLFDEEVDSVLDQIMEKVESMILLGGSKMIKCKDHEGQHLAKTFVITASSATLEDIKELLLKSEKIYQLS